MLLSYFILHPSPLFAQGSLTPPGAPGLTFKTLSQVEPRIPISVLPFSTTNAGSYYLTTNLIGTSGGISIQASSVTLDLMGFELVGGTGSAISVSGTRSNLWVGNGTIRNWPGGGVAASTADYSRFQGLRLFGNTGIGLQCRVANSVVDCVAVGNTSHGISVSDISVISGCLANGNGTDGIAATSAARVSECAAHSNGDDGIEVGQNCSISGCTANFNLDDGIVVSTRSTVSGCMANSNKGDGIQASNDSLLTGNNCTGNGYDVGLGAGIHLTGIQNRVDRNHTHGNDIGIMTDVGGNLIIRNSASGNTGAGNITLQSGDRFGPINTVPVGVVTNHPWANFPF